MKWPLLLGHLSMWLSIRRNLKKEYTKNPLRLSLPLAHVDSV